MSGAKDSKSKFNAIIIAVIVGLLGINAFLLFNKVQQDRVNSELQQEVDEAGKLKLELEKQYYQALSELESMKTNNEELNALIDQQKQELEEEKNKISRMIGQGKKNRRELDEARDRLASMRTQLDGYITEVNDLKEQNQLLEAANLQLTDDNRSLEGNLAEQRTANEELTTAKAALVSEKEALESQNSQLGEKVTLASVVKVDNVEASSWKVKKSGKPTKTRSASKTDRVKVCFTTTQNEVTTPGVEQFYVRLINPLGETLALENLGSGIMKNVGTAEDIR
ncbi:MAG: hypothetical protein AAF146_07030, partial [Bacteroidota bacterium]